MFILRMYMCLCIYVCMNICIYVCIYVHMYIQCLVTAVAHSSHTSTISGLPRVLFFADGCRSACLTGIFPASKVFVRLPENSLVLRGLNRRVLSLPCPTPPMSRPPPANTPGLVPLSIPPPPPPPPPTFPATRFRAGNWNGGLADALPDDIRYICVFFCLLQQWKVT